LGVTSKTLKRRLSEHVSSSVCGEKRALQNAIRKHGRDAFEIHPLQDVENKEEAFKLEKHWIDLLNTYEGSHGYNMTTGGESDFSHSEKTCQKIGDAHRNKNVSDETRKKLSNAHKGKTRTKEHRQNISKAHKGKKVSEQTRKKISKIHSGKTVSSKTREKISRTLESKQMSEKHMKAIRDQNSKLSTKQAREIKWVLENTDKTQKEISSLYPISQRVVSDINTKKIWKNVKPQKPSKWQE